MMLENLSGNMEYVKQNILQSHFLQRDHKDFLKDVEVRLIDKMQASDPTKKEFYWMRTLLILYPDALILKVTTYSPFRRKKNTFTAI